MTLVTLAVSNQDCKVFHDSSMDPLAQRKMFANVEKDTIAKTIPLELELGLNKPGKKLIAKPTTLHSLGTIFGKIVKNRRKRAQQRVALIAVSLITKQIVASTRQQ